MSVDTSIYRVRIFSERGYRRIKCGSCGAYFWSLKERDNCGDAPCTDYTFFDIKLKVPPLSVTEVKDRFLEFFRRRGHEVIRPHPVLARWRDDLYLTIASIIVFQPHVTSGIVPPPANPLVIAQPCIRLEDIDSVGYTFGRHLTNFIMGGHHAFNYPDKHVYFTHETVEYAREFFVEELGVPEDEITFKESWWEGGGNAGPCFEVAIGGLEVATLVFMMFEERNGKYVEMPIKIVDTGYGIERIAWLTQKTPTAFHAIYGNLVSDYFKILGLEEPSEEVFRTAIKYVGRLNPKTEELYSKLKELVAKELKEDLSTVSSLLDGSIKVFTLLDHVKTALLMLGDGAVPSNTGEGYLVRLVLRRIFRILALLKLEEVVQELIRRQVSYWSKDYPQIWRMRSYIEDVVENELRKYENVISRAPTLVRKYMKRGKLGADELIEMYDSHGVPPEVVRDVARKFGVEVQVPSDFYSRLASRHAKAPIKPKEKLKVPEDVVSAVKDLPPTGLLFHKDPYLREFSAKVVKVLSNYLVLDRTAFYPEGGGQACDTGFIELPSGTKLRVIDVQKVSDVVLHKVSGDCRDLREGIMVKGVIDWFRRFTLMRHHTATHIILGAARKVLGEHVWQAGAEKTVDHARLDITHYKPLTPEEVRRIEEVANEVVNSCIPVETAVMPKYDAEEKYGFRLYQGGVVLAPTVRVVKIGDHDIEACFGTHVGNTKEVGAIKIVKVDRIADGVVRLEYVAGTKVSDYARNLEDVIKEASSVLGGDVRSRAKAVTEELGRVRSLLSAYRKVLTKALTKELLSNSVVVSGVRVCVSHLTVSDLDLARDVLMNVTKEEGVVAVLAVPLPNKQCLLEVSVSKELSSKVSAAELLRYVVSKLGGKGGGKKDHATGRVPKEAEEVIESVRELVTEYVSARVSS